MSNPSSHHSKHHSRRFISRHLTLLIALVLAAAALLIYVNHSSAAGGDIDPAFNAGGAGANSGVQAVAVQPDGKIVIGGGFTSYNGDAAASDRVMRLDGDFFVTWPAGDATDKIILLPIVNDGTPEGNETLTLTLAVMSGGATLGSPSSSTLTIHDPNTAPAVVSGTKTVSGGTAPGSIVTYTITVTNNLSTTQQDNPGNEFSDVLPAGLSLLDDDATSGAVSDNGTNTVNWNGSIPGSGGSVTITIRATINNDVALGTRISNQGTINYDGDNNATNESSALTDDPSVVGGESDPTSFTVLSPANISGRKSVSGALTPGSTITYVVQLSSSPSSSTQFDNPGNEFIDVLPSDLTLVSADASSGIASATIGTNTVTWNGVIGGGGDSVTITITATIKAGTEGHVVSNQGTINYDADGNGTNEASRLTDDPNTSGSDATVFTVCAANHVVTTNADSGAGSLRQAVADACPGTSITFSGVTSPIALTGGEILIDKNLTITGPNVSLTISGSNNSRIFSIQHDTTVTISNLTFTNGKSSAGGAIFNAGSLTITNSTFTGNNAVGLGAEGGAIDSEGYPSAGGRLTIINSTISGNASDGDGGGVLNCGNSVATLTNVTITNNRSDANGDDQGNGGGLAQVSSSDLTLNNTIIAGNLRGAEPSSNNDVFVRPDDPMTPDPDASFIDAASSNNLIGVDTGLSTDISNGDNGNQIGTAASPIDPKLRALASNGGPTQTHLLLPNSPALNAGNSSLALDQNGSPLTTDQRGSGFARVAGSAIDIGAVEANYSITATAGTPQSATINSAFATAMKATVTESGTAQNNIPVTFTAPGSGASGTFPGPSTTAAAATNSSGVATAPTFTANAIGGSYSVIASIGTGLPTATFSLTNNKLSQTINFPAPTDKTFGNADFTVTATATSGLAVSFAASGNCTVTGTGTGTVHITGAGSCTITASQAGDATYSAAPDVPRTFNIAKAATTTAVTSSVNPSSVGQSVTFTATVTSPAGTPTGTVQFKDNGVNLGAAQALNGSGVAQLTTSALTGGAHPITADYSGDVNFNTSSGTLSGGQIVGAALMFSSTTYNTTENSRAVTITVQRAGDPSLAVTVDYATPDDSSATPTILPCSTAGFVSPRCDFTTASGTLKFASGETSKTFEVMISQDNFVEGNESFSITLSNPTNGAGLGTPSTATVIIADDVTEPTANPIDDSTNFVRQHYHDFLNREPVPADAAGLNFWVNQIESCGSDQACRDLKRINVSGAFFLSIEFQQTGFYVYRTYKAGFGDINPPSVPVPVRYLPFVTDTQEVQRGVIVGQGAWQAQLDANKQAYALAFVKRAAFLTRYPGSTSATSFVDTLNANAGNVLNPTERAALISQLTPNPSDPALRGDVLMKVAENAVLKQQEMNRSFVLMQYFGYLRRNPDAAPESGLNFNGFNFWLNKLNQFNGNFVNADMVKAFITSSEYRKRFGQ